VGMAHVFISYKRDDVAFAKELEDQLRNANFEVWRDEQIPGGKKWLEEIESQIYESFVVIVVITPEATKSEWVNYERIFAHGAEIDVIPVYLKTIKNFPNRLDDYQLIDFRSKYEWGELISRLANISDEKQQRIHIPRRAPVYVMEGLKLLNSGVPENKIM
jgi:hypothetical protein